MFLGAVTLTIVALLAIGNGMYWMARARSAEASASELRRERDLAEVERSRTAAARGVGAP